MRRPLRHLMICLREYFLTLRLLIILLIQWHILRNAHFRHCWVFLFGGLGARNRDEDGLAGGEVLVEVVGVLMLRDGQDLLHLIVALQLLPCLLSNHATT